MYPPALVSNKCYSSKFPDGLCRSAFCNHNKTQEGMSVGLPKSNTGPGECARHSWTIASLSIGGDLHNITPYTVINSENIIALSVKHKPKTFERNHRRPGAGKVFLDIT